MPPIRSIPSSVHQLDPEHELLIPRDEIVGAIFHRGLVIGQSREDHHLLPAHADGVGETATRASHSFPSHQDTFGSGKAVGWLHWARCGGEAGAGQSGVNSGDRVS